MTLPIAGVRLIINIFQALLNFSSGSLVSKAWINGAVCYSISLQYTHTWRIPKSNTPLLKFSHDTEPTFKYTRFVT